MQKVPFILLAGARDQEAKTLSFRYRDGSQENDVSIVRAKEIILSAIADKKQV